MQELIDQICAAYEHGGGQARILQIGADGLPMGAPVGAIAMGGNVGMPHGSAPPSQSISLFDRVSARRARISLTRTRFSAICGTSDRERFPGHASCPGRSPDGSSRRRRVRVALPSVTTTWWRRGRASSDPIRSVRTDSWRRPGDVLGSSDGPTSSCRRRRRVRFVASATAACKQRETDQRVEPGTCKDARINLSVRARKLKKFPARQKKTKKTKRRGWLPSLVAPCRFQSRLSLSDPSSVYEQRRLARLYSSVLRNDSTLFDPVPARTLLIATEGCCRQEAVRGPCGSW